jgi:hypothetical protein
MSATTRRQSSVAFGRGARRARSFVKRQKGYHGRANIALVTERNYWVRTEHGRVWGPYTLGMLSRLKGQITEKAEASLDGKSWQPGAEFPELRDLLVPARKLERPPPPRLRMTPTATPPVPPRHTPAHGVQPVTAPPPPQGPPELPEHGDLAQVSPLRLYALAALNSASGWLQLELEKQRMLQISFRRGTPEHLSSDDPDLSLTRFLQARGVVQPAAALAAEEQSSKTGRDLLSVLFQLQLIPPADAHRLLGEYASFLLDRALLVFRGKFTFEKEAPPPPGSFPLGSRWALLSDSVRRLDATVLRARLGKRLARPVVRSGGLGLGRVEELSLNAHEARLYSAIDGIHTGEELLKAGDPAKTLRLLYLLTELGHLAFAGGDEQHPGPTPEPRPPQPVPEPKPPQPQPPIAEKPPGRELPKIARPVPPDMARLATPPPMMKVAPAAPRPATQPPPRAPAPAAQPPPRAPAPAAQPRPPAAAPQPAPVRPAAPRPSAPPPAFASAPPGEKPQQALNRLSALLQKLEAGDHFEALGITRKTATAAEAKRNFFVLAKELHPDTVSDSDQVALREVKERLFARINAASHVLGDDKRRKEYEEELDGKAASVDVARIFAAEESFQRAEILIKARKYKEGLELLEDAIEMNDAEAEFYAWRGHARFLLAQDRRAIFDDAAADCRKAIKMQERCLPAHLFLGQMAKVVGDQKLAARCFEHVLQIEPGHIDAQRELRLMGKKV